MAMFDVFRKRKESQRFTERQKEKSQERKAASSPQAADTAPAVSHKRAEGDSRSADLVLRSPQVTEKAARAGERGAYTFAVDENATKPLIKRAVEELYGVSVRKVRVTNTPAKWRFSRGRYGRRPGGRKAVVYVKKGETIDTL